MIENMQGKLCLITGGSRGIGKAAASGLAALGAQVVIVARDRGRGEAAMAEIRARSGNEAVDMLLADLSSQASVRALAREYTERYGRLDVLINNAGAMFTRRSETVDGIEMTFALNHLAYFLLTDLLLDLLKASAPSRIVNVSSDAHHGAALDPDNLQGERSYRGFAVYGRSKLANILFTRELARRLEGTGVTANCLHPGLIASGFNKNNGPLMRLAMTMIGPFIKQADEGAETVIYLASSPEVEGITGKYFVKCRPVEPSPAASDDTVARWLWDTSARMTGVQESIGPA